MTIASAAVLAVAPVLVAPASAAPASNWLVTLRGNNAVADAQQQGHRYGVTVHTIWQKALRGYAATMTAGQAQALRHDPTVVAVEPDAVTHATGSGQHLPTGVDRISDPVNAGSTAPAESIDGHDDVRIDADIAVLDTGIDYTHPDLNVVGRTDCGNTGCTDNAGTDGYGHGTHVAGIAAAIDNGYGVVGVAPGARLWSVRVLDNNGNGTLSQLISGLNWVTAHASTIDVVNVSLGCVCPSTAVDTAINTTVAAGVTIVAAAGNNHQDASTFVPANNPNVIAVSALADSDGRSGGLGGPDCRGDADDTSADYSNYGATVAIAAPGNCILSTYKGDTYAVLSGTSMASPHVAGAAALLASQPAYRGHPSLIRQALLAAGNYNWTDTSGDGIQEPLLDVSSFTPATVPSGPTPQISVSDAWAVQGSSSSASFTVNLSSPPSTGEYITVVASTSNGSAVAGKDYTAVPRTTLTFAPGETSKTVTVPILSNPLPSAAKTFTLNLSTPMGAVLVDSQGVGTITEPQGPLTVSVSDASVLEPANGSTATANFQVSLSAPVPAGASPVSVKVATADGTALAGTDYTAVPSTTLTFATGEQTKTVPVTVLGDALSEPNETFTLRLSGQTGSTIADNSGTGTILDPGGPITASVSDFWGPEGNSGTTPQTFTVSLSAPPGPGQTVSVTAATSNVTATAGSDYQAVPPTVLTFGPGQQSQTVTVNVIGDTTVEPNETYYLNLSNPVGLTIADSRGVGTIANDDGTAPTPAPNTISVTDGWAVEPSSGSTTANVTVSLAQPAVSTVTVNVASANGTATAGTDYTAIPSTKLTFAPGQQTITVPVTVLSDGFTDGNETFYLNLSSPTGAVVADSQSLLTIDDPQGPLTASVGDVTVHESSGTPATASFPVTLSAPPAAGQTVSVKVATSNGSATAGVDYTALATTTLVFSPGQTSQTVNVPVLGDGAPDGNETFNLNLSSPVGLTVADTQGIATLADDNAPVAVSVNDASAVEGDSGTTPMTFTLTLSQPPVSTQNLSVNVATVAGTATPGSDYVSLPTTKVSFAPGQTTAVVTVQIVGDLVAEPTQAFTLTLSGQAGGLTVADSSAVGTILDDD